MIGNFAKFHANRAAWPAFRTPIRKIAPLHLRMRTLRPSSRYRRHVRADGDTVANQLGQVERRTRPEPLGFDVLQAGGNRGQPGAAPGESSGSRLRPADYVAASPGLITPCP